MRRNILLPLFAASAWADYAPTSGQCVTESNFWTQSDEGSGFVRRNDGPCRQEVEWVDERRAIAGDNLRSFLRGLNLTDIGGDVIDEMTNNTNVGLSFSGGSIRALLTGAGQISALDNRTSSAFSGNATALKGLLESATYISALSGGSLMLGTMAFQNWTSAEHILATDGLWNVTQPPLSSDMGFWTSILQEIRTKESAGYDISLIDAFGVILSRYMFGNYNDTGVDFTWSGIQNVSQFTDHSMPLPIILATGGVGSNDTNFENNVFEINPFEFGSWDPYAGGFVPIQNLGTNFGANSSSSCVQGFDKASFMVAASCDFIAGWNTYLPLLNSNNSMITAEANNMLADYNVTASDLRMLLNLINSNWDDILYAMLPNPYYRSSIPEDSELTENDTLSLVDGGFFSEALPLDPFLVPGRDVDAVIAFDNSDDYTDGFPHGGSLNATRHRWETAFPDDSFYAIPSQEEFLEYNGRPFFIGCNGTGLGTNEGTGYDTDRYTKPLIVYVPNNNRTYLSNTSSMVFTQEERGLLVRGGFEVATRGNFSEDPEFAQCVGCAILERSFERSGRQISEQCSRCFERYCYNGAIVEGTLNTTSVSGNSTSSSNSTGSSNTSLPSASSTAAANGAGILSPSYWLLALPFFLL